MTNEPRRPFEPPHVMELCPRVVTWAYLEAFRTWTPEHRIEVGLAMSALLGTGMKREIQRAHPDWPARKVSLELGRLSWGWKAAPPLYGPLEEEARARGESPTRGAEFLRSWRLDPEEEPRPIRSGKKRTLEEASVALDRIFSARLCG